MKYVMTLLIMLAFSATGFAGERLDERAQVEFLKEKYEAQSEVRLWDKTRCDLLSATHAYEVDWAHNFAEGVGQALYYGKITERKPGLILLVKDLDKEQRFIYRARIACDAAGVELFVELAKRPMGQKRPIGQDLVGDDEPSYVYFIYDPEDKKYFKQGMLGLTGWDVLQKATPWMVKKDAERQLATLYGTRADRCVIKRFLLMPVKQQDE